VQVMWLYERWMDDNAGVIALYDVTTRTWERLGVIYSPEAGVFNCFPRGGVRCVCTTEEQAKRYVETHYVEKAPEFHQASFLSLISQNGITL